MPCCCFCSDILPSCLYLLPFSFNLAYALSTFLFSLAHTMLLPLLQYCAFLLMLVVTSLHVCWNLLFSLLWIINRFYHIFSKYLLVRLHHLSLVLLSWLKLVNSNGVAASLPPPPESLHYAPCMSLLFDDHDATLAVVKYVFPSAMRPIGCHHRN